MAQAQAIWPFPRPSTICTADATRQAAVMPGSPAQLQLRLEAVERHCCQLQERIRYLERAQPTLYAARAELAKDRTFTDADVQDNRVE